MARVSEAPVAAVKANWRTTHNPVFADRGSVSKKVRNHAAAVALQAVPAAALIYPRVSDIERAGSAVELVLALAWTMILVRLVRSVPASSI
jgi:hypothetical protein